MSLIITTFRHEQSINGYPLPLLISGLQKYIRRGDLEKAQFCLIELDLFELAADQRAAQRIRSNMVNRLIACMSEEVGICDAGMPVIMRTLYTRWESDHERTVLHKMLTLLVNARKQRLVSDYRAVYNMHATPDSGRDMRHQRLIESYCEHWTPLRTTMQSYRENCQVTETHSNLSLPQRSVKERFDGFLLDQDQQAFPLLAAMMRNQVSVSDAWSALTEFCNTDAFEQREASNRGQAVDPECRMRASLRQNAVSALYSFFKKLKHKEQWLYLIHACMLVVLRNSAIYSIRPEDDLLEDREVVDELYARHQEGYRIELDEFVNDKHCGNRKSTSLDFALVGAQVENECEELHNRCFRDFYLDMKRLEQGVAPKIEKVAPGADSTADRSEQRASFWRRFDEQLALQPARDLRAGSGRDNEPLLSHAVYWRTFSSLLIGLPVAQQRTSGYKKFVWIDWPARRVIKGPYSCEPGSTLLRAISVNNAALLLQQHCKNQSVEQLDLVRGDAGYYLIGRYHGDEIRKEHVELVSNRVDKNVRVLQRKGPIMRVSDTTCAQHAPCAEAILEHLLVCYMLKVGDTGLHNMLWHEGKVYGIDMEEHRATGSSTVAPEQLFKHPPRCNCFKLRPGYFETLCQAASKNLLTEEQCARLVHYCTIASEQLA